MPRRRRSVGLASVKPKLSVFYPKANYWAVSPYGSGKNMIAGLGTDLVEVQRIRESIERFGDRFLRRIYTDAERSYCLSKANCYERFAARFAAKEAGMKAIGTGWSGGVTWHDFQISNDSLGKPMLALAGEAGERAARLGVTHVLLSMTHTALNGFAVVVLETNI